MCIFPHIKTAHLGCVLKLIWSWKSTSNKRAKSSPPDIGIITNKLTWRLSVAKNIMVSAQLLPTNNGYCHLAWVQELERGASPAYNDIILLHRQLVVMDAWDNQQMQQSGPSMDRILEKGLPIFTTLDLLELATMVNFYNKLQKTSGLFLLPLMLFDAINLNMAFEGLCPPGLGLPQSVAIAGALIEVLPCLLLEWDSQTTSLVMIICAELNNGYDLLFLW